jgi:hypothetical protein
VIQTPADFREIAEARYLSHKHATIVLEQCDDLITAQAATPMVWGGGAAGQLFGHPTDWIRLRL